MSSKEVAAQLGITFKTTTCHRTRILDKLGARNAADLAGAAIRMGLVDL